MLVRVRTIWLLLATLLTLGDTVAHAAEDFLTPPAGLAVPAQSASMPAFSLPDVSGEMVQADDLQGQVVIVRFWATW